MNVAMKFSGIEEIVEKSRLKEIRALSTHYPTHECENGANAYFFKLPSDIFSNAENR